MKSNLSTLGSVAAAFAAALAAAPAAAQTTPDAPAAEFAAPLQPSAAVLEQVNGWWWPFPWPWPQPFGEVWVEYGFVEIQPH